MFNFLENLIRALQQAIILIFHFLTANYFHQVLIPTPILKSRTMKNIIILGGSYAGVSTAHRLLKQSSKTPPFKVILVSPNTHFYWSMASPRGVIPGQLTDEQIFRPIAEGFLKYPAAQFEFILASAESLNTKERNVGISSPTGKQTLDYDFLVLATGSNANGNLPYKGLGSTEVTKKALHDFQGRIKNANTIVVAGAGVTGVEAAGELGFEYGIQKNIILTASGPTVLEETPASVSRLASKALQDLKVEIKLRTRVTKSIQLADGRQELSLSNGETLLTDMYIPTFGLIPNSSYIPTRFLDTNGSVIVDNYLQVQGLEHVWAIGDVSALEPSQFITTDKQSAHLAKNLALILNNMSPLPYKVAASRFMGLQIGKKAGTGHFGSWRVPSFVIVWARKNLFTDNLGPTVDGSLF